MKPYLLKQPIITEKSMLDAGRGVYTFLVDLKATKSQIKSVIEEVFGVQVKKVTTSVRQPASKRTGNRRLPATSSPAKIARVWLKEGDTIDLFEFKEN